MLSVIGEKQAWETSGHPVAKLVFPRLPLWHVLAISRNAVSMPWDVDGAVALEHRSQQFPGGTHCRFSVGGKPLLFDRSEAASLRTFTEQEQRSEHQPRRAGRGSAAIALVPRESTGNPGLKELDDGCFFVGILLPAIWLKNLRRNVAGSA